jgi:mannose-6-phosphate isomerase-like protein (cupin superfamily)
VELLRREADAPVVTAPDGSAVRPLSRTARGSMATFRLAPGQVASAVVHRSVDELWYVVSGRGELWRRSPGPQAQEDVALLEAGVSVDLPVGTAFRFRAERTTELVIVGVTMPPWPLEGGADEAVPVADGPTWPT